MVKKLLLPSYSCFLNGKGFSCSFTIKNCINTLSKFYYKTINKLLIFRYL